jgi:hypothetical protein
VARSEIVRQLQGAREAYDQLTEALASGDPRSAIVANLDAITALIRLLDELLAHSVRITRRRT